ncbi:MAG TPA: TIGR01777 family oxidoreductase [Frankiaceae bacterium]|nr:TIGR01777 family oxidoreductase [Frankiaceae bacterium]
MKIVVSGGSGLIGSALVPHLRAGGHEVVRLVRHEPAAPDEVQWDPARGLLNADDLAGVEAAVHLSGASVSRRWTQASRRAIRASRVDSTTLLAETLASLSPLPKVLLSGSAVGYYGDTGDRTTDEEGPRGEGFLADVVGDWEAAAHPAMVAGIRVCRLRTGIVLARQGGALRLQLPIFKLGLGGRLGSGRQFTSWITLEDEISAIAFLLTAEDVSGPVNLVAPNPETNRDFTKALAAALHRPAVAAVPPIALRLALDGFAEEGLLIGQRLTPRVLTDAGFTFRHPDLPEALESVLKK